MTTWTHTRPQTPGDFNASTERNPDARRHFDGRRWSAPWYADDPSDVADRARRVPDRTEGDRIEWRPL